MPRKSATFRKVPTQDRSKDTVKRILDAARMLLEERGYDGTSTNRIAAAAGISPGSLYQYFANKDAILHAVVAEYTQQLLDQVTRNLASLVRSEHDVPLSAAIEAQVDAMLERPQILRVISGQLPGRTSADVLRPLRELMTATIKGYAIATPDQSIDMDVDAATWIIVQLLGSTIRYVVDEPPIAKDVFVTEMTRFVMSSPVAWRCSARPAAVPTA